MRINRVVAALIEHHDQILLVQQRGAYDLAASWALPGGSIEPGEMTLDGLSREVLEETGFVLDPTVTPTLLYLTEVHDPIGSRLTIAHIFSARVLNAGEDFIHQDPDNEILRAIFVPRAVAAVRLALNPFLPMSEPAVAAVQKRASSLWVYQIRASSPVRLVPAPDL